MLRFVRNALAALVISSFVFAPAAASANDGKPAAAHQAKAKHGKNKHRKAKPHKKHHGKKHHAKHHGAKHHKKG